MHGKHQSFNVGVLHADRAGRLQSVQFRHPDIQNHHFGRQRLGLLDYVQAIRCLAANFNVRLRLQQRPQTPKHHRVIVRDQYADPLARTCRTLASLCGTQPAQRST
jgi:hypothetical protein